MPLPANWATIQLNIAKARKSHFLKRFVDSLEATFYCHLIIVYLHDTSTFRFLIRTAVQLVFLSPHLHKVKIPPQLNHRPIILMILLTNLYCILCHFFHAYPLPIFFESPPLILLNKLAHTVTTVTSPNFFLSKINPNHNIDSVLQTHQSYNPLLLSSNQPSLGDPIEASGLKDIGKSLIDTTIKYGIHQSPKNILHGGLTIEFIGDPPFTSCIFFLIIDFVLLFLQMLLYTLNFCKDEDKDGGSTQPNEPLLDHTSQYQEIANEEENIGTPSENSITMPPPAAPAPTQPNNRESRAEEDQSSSSLAHIYDSYSGNLNIRELHPIRSIIRSWNSAIRYRERQSRRQRRRHGSSRNNRTQTQTETNRPVTGQELLAEDFFSQFFDVTSSTLNPRIPSGEIRSQNSSRQQSNTNSANNSVTDSINSSNLPTYG